MKKYVPSKSVDAKLEAKATQKKVDATKIIPGGNNTCFKILWHSVSCIEIRVHLIILIKLLMEQVIVVIYSN